MDLFDIFQQYRIEKTRNEALSEAGDAKHRTISNEINISELEAKLDHLSLVCMAMSELFEEIGFSKAMLLKKIEEIDLRDGKLDGKIAPTNTCSGCNRVVAPRHVSCLYCGTKINKANVF